MMNAEIALLGTLFIACALGIIVYFTNRVRLVNQHFLLFACIIALWQLSGWYILQAQIVQQAVIGIRLASIFAAIIPTACHLLRLSIKFPLSSFLGILIKGKWFILLSVGTTIFCLTDFFLFSAKLPDAMGELQGALAEPLYGKGLALYALFFLLSGVGLIIAFRKDMRQLKGAPRAELAFVVLGATVAFSLGSLLSLSIPLLLGTSQYVPFSNALSIITLVGTIGYGIATHKILGILTIIRKIIAYALLCIYLVTLYILTWFVFSIIIRQFSISSPLPAQIIASIVVAFSMAPVHGRLQKVADKLISSKAMNIPATIKAAGGIFHSVTTMNALLNQFTALLMKELRPEYVCILSLKADHFIMEYENSSMHSALVLSSNSPLTSMIKETKEPVSRDSLYRVRQTPATKSVIKLMLEHDISVATGVFSKEGLNSIVLFGSKIDDRIYDRMEQDALQILCNQFSVALENAHLYTEMQDSKIQNEIMLDQLVSGVVVANPDGEITLINHEAQRITGIDDKNVIGQHITILPKEIYLALEVTLKNKTGVRNIDATLFPQEDSKESRRNIRMGSSFLFGHDDKPMGALLVFTDVTELKGLEEQVRRTDQLSSVGTLAAGMAHEIKNPLVTIKTFTQLLPKRYGDEDFRNDFSSLVAHEVNRIDGIVNELLSFSKPAQPHLLPMNIQETIDQSLKLIHEQLVQKNITLTNNCRAASTHIFGDAKLLSQALINLNLNAIEAIGETGSITFGTLNCSHRFANGDSPGKATTRKCIRLQISDTGKGIQREDLQKIFDPFFTSKSEGTGMGLSVAHGIISEHHGVIEVESEPGRGTSFYLYIPLLEEGAVL